jgi:hypothetical protein
MMPEITRERKELFRILADQVSDDFAIVYRKSLNVITGGVLATMLLQQILWRYKQNNKMPFYKFKEPCTHKLYRENDSWTEELGFSRREFDTALKRIGQKVNRLASRDDTALVYYWNDITRLTWYEPNLLLVGESQAVLYEKAQSVVIVKAQSAFTTRRNPPLVLRTEINKTENTRIEDNTPLSYTAFSNPSFVPQEVLEEVRIRHSPRGDDSENFILKPDPNPTKSLEDIAFSALSDTLSTDLQVLAGIQPTLPGLPDDGKIGGGPPNPLSIREGKTSQKPVEYSEGFLAFWALYPRKKKKPAAYRAWLKQKCDSFSCSQGVWGAAPNLILEAVKADKALKRAEEFIPYPATWINDRTWEEEAIQEDKERETQRARNRAALDAWKAEQQEKKNAPQ